MKTQHEVVTINRIMFKELTHISAEMKAIVNRSEFEGRKMDREEQEALEQLTIAREALVSDIIFTGYV